ncbi:hypothetical protein ABIA32_006618 [Streptacidiphilus sp. MAP12-20]
MADVRGGPWRAGVESVLVAAPGLHAAFVTLLSGGPGADEER